MKITLTLIFILSTSQLFSQISRVVGSYPWRPHPTKQRHRNVEVVENLDWGFEAAAHLLRRGGFSAPPEEIGRIVGKGFPDALEELFKQDEVDDSEMEAGLAEKNLQLIRQNQNGRYRTNVDTLQQWWLYRMINSKHQLLEKMTFFWHDHFATSVLQIHFVLGAPEGDDPIIDGETEPLMLIQNGTLRKHALGNFKEMVHEIARDPAMILWLNNAENRVGKPNENWARELFELFTLGESSETNDYTEMDIQEAARAFTGWTIVPPRLSTSNLPAFDFRYSSRWHDFEPKTVLDEVIVSAGGQASIIDGDRVIDLIFEQTQTAIFITKKLWEYFVYPNPDEQIVEELAGVFRSENYEISPLMKAIFSHPQFMSVKALRSKIKSPIEFAVGAFRELGVKDPRNLSRLSERFGLGQQLFAPPDVGGWTNDEGWINTGTIIGRYNFMTFLSCNRGRSFQGLPTMNRDARFDVICHGRQAEDQIDIEKIIETNNLQSAADIVHYFGTALLQGSHTLDDLYILEEYMNTGLDGLPDPFDINDPQIVDTKVRGVIFLLSLLPTYQLN